MSNALQRISSGVGIFVLVFNAIVLIGVITHFALYGESILLKRARLQKAYEDKDGAATENSQKEFSARGSIVASLIFSALGLGISLWRTIDRGLEAGQTADFSAWTDPLSWISIIIVLTFIAAERNCITRYQYGLASASMAAAILVLIGVGLIGIIDREIPEDHTNVLLAVKAASAVLTWICSMSIPRRPSVEHDGQMVDRQYTVSALRYYSITWAEDMLGRARHKDSLALGDLPALHYWARSSNLLDWFGAEGEKRALWKAIIYMHWPDLLFQTVFAIISSAIQFAPQLAMYGLLRLLEQRQAGDQISPLAWSLVLGLGLSIIVAAWTEQWNAWIAHATVGSQVRSELSIMIFAKATRSQDIKGSQISEKPITQEARSAIPIMDGQADETAVATQTKVDPKVATVPDDPIEKSKQSTINLVSVDTLRIASFVRFHVVFISIITEVVVSVFFLYRLLGWIPLLAGFGAFALSFPLNIYASKRYAEAQDELMTIRDRKLATVTEALQGIRQIKFSAQETQWQDRIGKVRQAELATQWRVFMLDTVVIFCFILGPILLSAVALTVYASIYGGLSASVAFTSLTVFSALEFSLGVAPEAISDGLEAWVSAARIDKYLETKEREGYMTDSDRVHVQDATIGWPSEEIAPSKDAFTLQNLNFTFPHQELSLIAGPTGSGKSLLLSSLLGEADLQKGAIGMPAVPSSSERYDHHASKSNWLIDSAVAFVAQIPWIENATIKENILFGLPYDKGRYDKVIECCALTKDLEILPEGDGTDIGFNGINLSGGQRWRVTFARALYSRAGILVLDDIFSAVDTHVGRHLFEQGLTGELGQNRTRILVTHHVELCLPKASFVVLLKDGFAEYSGTPEALRAKGVLEEMKDAPVTHRGTAARKASFQADEGEAQLRKVISRSSQKKGIDAIVAPQSKKFVEDETKEKGSVKLGVYQEYLSASGGMPYWVPILVLYVAYEGLLLGRSWFISLWTRAYDTEEASVMSNDSILRYINQLLMANPAIDPSSRMQMEDSPAHRTLTFYLTVYLGLSLTICVGGILRYYFVYTRSIRASKQLFDKMTFAVLRAPLRWLDTVPVGRILNRFTSDFTAIDSRLCSDIAFFLYEIIAIFGIVIAGSFVSPWMLLVAPLLVVACVWVASRYLDGAREVKRLESIAKSPIFEQFGSTLTGIATIRAFDKTDIYIKRMFKHIDAHASAYWHVWLFNRWIAFRLNLVGAVFATLVAGFVAFAKIDASLAGFALGFALQYSMAIVWATRFYANVELSMNSVERVSEYSSIAVEDQSETIAAPAAWPTEGRLEVNDLVVGYAPDLGPVLHGLSFTAEPGTRVGVVGRTGAGKSSLTLALFRFLEARSGSITIDGIDVAKISLRMLRSRLAIIPQDPVLFSGTVRSNLDPFDNYSDSELEDALDRVQLHQTSTGRSTPAIANDTHHTQPDPPPASSQSINLNTHISESGLNLSQGQRQLLCLARAIVSRPKILILDEATSAVDKVTDELIQRSIRHEFRGSTLLVIAHRLSTIADFDKILVLKEGKAVEFGSPNDLMSTSLYPGGDFRSMVEMSGEKQKLCEIIDNS